MASLLALLSLLPVALVAAAITRRTVAWAYLAAGSALAIVLTAIAANAVGGVAFELTVLAIAGALRVTSSAAASRRRARNLRRRQERQLARAQAERIAA